MKCSVCSNEIDQNYCSKCGQYFNPKKITSATILEDLFEKSFIKNFKICLLNPKELVTNYWNGFRGFYYSPSRFLIIATLFTLLHSFFAKDFLGIFVTSKIAPQFTILIINIILMSLYSFIVYLKFKKTFLEHVILNIYTVSLWTILFIPISIILNSLDINKDIEHAFFLPYHLLIMIWNSNTFKIKKIKRFIYVAINFILLYGIIFLLRYI
jgi:hypothetical protein